MGVIALAKLHHTFLIEATGEHTPVEWLFGRGLYAGFNVTFPSALCTCVDEPASGTA